MGPVDVWELRSLAAMREAKCVMDLDLRWPRTSHIHKLGLIAATSGGSMFFFGNGKTLERRSLNRDGGSSLLETIMLGGNGTVINHIKTGWIGCEEVLVAVDDAGYVHVYFVNSPSRPPVILKAPESAWGIAMHASKRYLAVSCNAHVIVLWDLTAHPQTEGSQGTSCHWEKQVLEGHENNIPSVAFNAAGTLLASGSIDGTCRIWAIQADCSSQVVYSELAMVWSVAFLRRADFGSVLVERLDERAKSEGEAGPTEYPAAPSIPEDAIVLGDTCDLNRVFPSKTEHLRSRRSLSQVCRRSVPPVPAGMGFLSRSLTFPEPLTEYDKVQYIEHIPEFFCLLVGSLNGAISVVRPLQRRHGKNGFPDLMLSYEFDLRRAGGSPLLGFFARRCMVWEGRKKRQLSHVIVHAFSYRGCERRFRLGPRQDPRDMWYHSLDDIHL